MNSRVNQLRALMAEQGLDAFLVTNEQNRRYLSGFTGSSGALLVTEQEGFLVTDFRYYEQAERQAPDWTLWKQPQSLMDAVADLLQAVRPTRIAVEGDSMTVVDWRKYQERAPEGSEWLPTEGLLRRLRAIKDEQEVELLRQAQAITDRAARELPRLIEPGRSERQVAWELEKLLREFGGDGPAFEIIVASGANAALPHHRPGDQLIEENQIVLVDFGARRQGYHSDMTRTYFTGEPPEEYARIYGVVLEAQQRVEAVLKAGFGAKAADSLARDFIREQGYGEAFGHSLGHGVGLEIHELPSLSFRAPDEDRLEAGHVVSVEPGIYLPGWGGVRIEDLVLVTESGIEIFTTTTKDIDAWRTGRA